MGRGGRLALLVLVMHIAMVTALCASSRFAPLYCCARAALPVSMRDSVPDDRPPPAGLDVEAAMAEAEALEAAAAAAEARLAAAQARAAVAAARAKATAAASAAKAKAMQVPEQPLVSLPDQPLVSLPEQPLVVLPDQPLVAVPGDYEETLATTDGVPVRLRWLNAAARRAAADGTRTVGQCIGTGDVLVSLGGVASASELESLLGSGLAACEVQRLRTGREPPPGGKDRFSVSDPLAFDSEVVGR